MAWYGERHQTKPGSSLGIGSHRQAGVSRDTSGSLKNSCFIGANRSTRLLLVMGGQRTKGTCAEPRDGGLSKQYRIGRITCIAYMNMLPFQDRNLGARKEFRESILMIRTIACRSFHAKILTC